MKQYARSARRRENSWSRSDRELPKHTVTDEQEPEIRAISGSFCFLWISQNPIPRIFAANASAAAAWAFSDRCMPSTRSVQDIPPRSMNEHPSSFASASYLPAYSRVLRSESGSVLTGSSSDRSVMGTGATMSIAGSLPAVRSLTISTSFFMPRAVSSGEISKPRFASFVPSVIMTRSSGICASMHAGRYRAPLRSGLPGSS